MITEEESKLSPKMFCRCRGGFELRTDLRQGRGYVAGREEGEPGGCEVAGEEGCEPGTRSYENNREI